MDRNAENILGSKGRLRILEALSQFGELSMSKIIRSTGLNYTNTELHLRRLKNMGLINEKRYGRIRMFEPVFKNIIVCLMRGRPIKLEIEY
jgi:DNA-binding transcriptional ArsR family regulator